MKSKTTEFTVDFIGGQGSLTKEEEQKVSEYLITQKLNKIKKQAQAIKPAQRKKVVTYN